MDNTLELGSNALIALEDEQLDDVAGGCFWHRRRHHRRGGGRGRGFGRRGFGGADVDVDIDIDINVINFSGNTIQAGGDVTVVLDQDN